MLKSGVRVIIVPKENAREGAIVNDVDVFGVSNISEVFDFLKIKQEKVQVSVIQFSKEDLRNEIPVTALEVKAFLSNKETAKKVTKRKRKKLSAREYVPLSNM